MATFTTNFNLRKPATTDFVDVVADINNNMDTIDTQLFNTQQANKVPVYKIKLADTTRSNTAVLADDPDLAGISLTAGKKYEIDLILFTSVILSSDFKFKLNFTGVATSNGIVLFSIVDGAGNLQVKHANVTGDVLLGTTFVVDTSFDNTLGFVKVKGKVFCTTTGILSLQWAQNAAVLNNTTVKKHSDLRVIEIVPS